MIHVGDMNNPKFVNSRVACMYSVLGSSLKTALINFMLRSRLSFEPRRLNFSGERKVAIFGYLATHVGRIQKCAEQYWCK